MAMTIPLDAPVSAGGGGNPVAQPQSNARHNTLDNFTDECLSRHAGRKPVLPHCLPMCLDKLLRAEQLFA